MGTLRILLCLALVIVIVTQAEGEPGRRFGSRFRGGARFGSRSGFSRSRSSRSRYSRSISSRTLLKGAALGAGVWGGYQLTKGASYLASAAMNPFANLYPNPQVAFQNWNSWRQQDGMLCRNDNDCKWLDRQMNCQISAIPPTPGNPNWFGGGAELQNIRGECECPPTFQFITVESRGVFGCSSDINEFGQESRQSMIQKMEARDNRTFASEGEDLKSMMQKMEDLHSIMQKIEERENRTFASKSEDLKSMMQKMEDLHSMMQKIEERENRTLEERENRTFAPIGENLNLIGGDDDIVVRVEVTVGGVPLYFRGHAERVNSWDD